MRHKYLIPTIAIIGMLMMCESAHGETVSQVQAKKVAAAFFNAAHGQYMSEPKFVFNGRRFTTQRLFNPFYVYNLPAGGFVIVSAENKAYPILGYSLRDTFDPNTISDGLRSVLESYALDIERIRHDDRIPSEAIEAWRDLPHYIDNILKANYSATDPTLNPQETLERVEAVAYGVGTDDQWADMYTPQQWEDMIDAELDLNGTVALGIVGRKGVTPMAVHGRKGDFYRIRTEMPDNALYRLFATEYLTDRQVASLTNPIGVYDINVEETPFVFYDEFIASTNEEKARRAKTLEEKLIVTEPRVHRYGGGFYTIDLPEEATIAQVYNLGGAMTRQFTYSGTASPHLNLMSEPTGFYIVRLMGKSGKVYGIKLVR